MKNIGVLILLVGLFFVSLANSNVFSTNDETDAKCAMPNFESAYEYAKAVFVGEVIGIEKEGKNKIIEFRVKKFWKGVEETKMKVFVYENMRYQSPYNVGETFLVFAKSNEEGGLFDGRCSRSRNMEGYAPSLKEDLKNLGEGKTCISLSKEKKEKKKETKRRVND